MTRNMFNQWHKLKKTGVNSTQGYTLPEILATLTIFGILTAVAVPSLVQQRGVSSADIDGRDQFQNIFQQVRNTAIASTSAMRIRPDPDQPDNKFLVEIARKRTCDFATKLSEEADDTENIKVLSSAGFDIGDVIAVGGTKADVIAVENGSLTLGEKVTKPEDTIVKLADDNWFPNQRLQADDLTLPQDRQNPPQPLVTFTPNEDWTMCVDSRGVAYTVDEKNDLIEDGLTLTFKNVNTENTREITIKTGGAIEVDD